MNLPLNRGPMQNMTWVIKAGDLTDNGDPRAKVR